MPLGASPAVSAPIWIASNCDAETAEYYVIIKNQLRLIGKPIPENDMWIAAVAVQHDLTLVTRDAQVANVENLRSERW